MLRVPRSFFLSLSINYRIIYMPISLYKGDTMFSESIFSTFYGRVSTDSDEQTSALENQEQYWLNYFEKNNLKLNPDCGAYYSREGNLEPRKGYYIDEGISGYKSKKYRKAFLRMIQDAKLGKFSKIYTRSISRFGRNVTDILNTIKELKKYNVGVYFEDINADTLNPNDEFKLLIFAGIAQEESRLKSASVQKGKMVAAKNGIWAGREPYGYDINNGKLVINEEEAKIVELIFDLYLQYGWGLSRIAKHLNSNNTPRKRSAKKWDHSLVGKILKNRIYIGEVWLHRTYIKDPQQNIIEIVPEFEQIKYIDENLRIIDDNKFNQVQQIKSERYSMFGDFKYKMVEEVDDLGNRKTKKVRIGIDRKNQRYSGAHIFSNLLRCNNCGGMLRFKKQKSTSGKIHSYYFCSNNDRLGSCEFRNLQREEELIEWIRQEIDEYRLDYSRHERNFAYFTELKFDLNEVKDKIISLQRNLEELKQDKEANFKLYSKELIDENEFANRDKKLKHEISQVEDEIYRLNNIDREIEIVRKKHDEFVQALKEIDLENLDNITLRKIIKEIKIFTHIDGKLYRYIEWKYLDESEEFLLDEHINKLLEQFNLTNSDS